MQSRQLIVPVSLVVLALAVGYGYWSSMQGTPATPAAPPVPVVLASAARQDMPVQLDVVGRAEAYETVTLKARVDGQVASLMFTEGQHVRQGDELIRLDATDFTLRLRQAEASVARDDVQLAKAKADTLRYVALRERNFVSEEKVNEMRTTERALAATRLADQAAVDLARSQLSYASIRAPFAGVVGAKLVFPGAAVKLNDTGLLVINRVRPLYVSFSIPERYLAGLRGEMAKGGEGCRREGCLKVAVTLPGDKSRVFEGRLRFVDNAVDAATGTIQLKALLANDDEALTPGQFVNLSLNLDTLHDVVVVPAEAIQQGPEGPFVFLINARHAAEVRKVEVGPGRRGLTSIVRGLQAGDTVVTDGQLRLTPGASVVSRPAPTPVARPQ